jgi:hypothetical protein
MIATNAPRPRLLPDRSFPAYAYLPGRFPHPVRHPHGHSYKIEQPEVPVEAGLTSEAFLWGIDLFNHGYYWEAHEAWEALWQGAKADPQRRLLYKGLILLAASGVKIREGKQQAAKRHAAKAAATLRQISEFSEVTFASEQDAAISELAELATAVSKSSTAFQFSRRRGHQTVFEFLLGPFG